MASAIEMTPIVVPAEGVNPQDVAMVVEAQPVDPREAGGNQVPVVTAMPINGSGLARTASAVFEARPVVVTRGSVPLLTCRCPNSDDLPDCCDEDCCLKMCGIPMYLFYGALVIFASFATTRLAIIMGIWDPAAWITFFMTLGLVLVVGCLCTGLSAMGTRDEDVATPCCLGFLALGVLAGLLCYGVSAPLTENWFLSEGAPAVRFVDPELATGERTEYTGKRVDLIASSFTGRLSEYGSTSAAILDAPTDVDASSSINVQDDYQEIEFALSSYVDTSLSVPIYFDDDDDAEVDSDPESVHIPQLCVAPVLRTCGVLPGGAPWTDINRGGVNIRTGVAPLNSSNLPSENPSINQAYCDARRRDTQQPCSFFDRGLECSAGASRPTDLYVSFFMYVRVQHQERHLDSRATCARTWQWAFDEKSLEGGPNAGSPSAFKADLDDSSSTEVYYPQPEQMGTPTGPGIFKLPEGMNVGMQANARLFGNPAPLTGGSVFHPVASIHTRTRTRTRTHTWRVAACCCESAVGWLYVMRCGDVIWAVLTSLDLVQATSTQYLNTTVTTSTRRWREQPRQSLISLNPGAVACHTTCSSDSVGQTQTLHQVLTSIRTLSASTTVADIQTHQMQCFCTFSCHSTRSGAGTFRCGTHVDK
jgi:hypothetical protein